MNRKEFLAEKHAGILAPLFSMKRDGDLGIGDISSLSVFLDFSAEYGFDIVEILPVNDLAPGVNCPYTALSGFAVDPVYIDVDGLRERKDVSGKKASSAPGKSRGIPYDRIRETKLEILRDSYRNFLSAAPPEEKRKFDDFAYYNGWWLHDYALFRFLKGKFNWSSWTSWPEEYRNRRRDALERIYREYGEEIDFFKYVQWIISLQWDGVKTKAEKMGIKIYGDLPFAVNQESADVWARPSEFILDCSIGAPPDEFSDEGQDWGLPAYNWPEIEKNDFEWWRMRVRKAGDFYHIYRLDHMVGFFRTWMVPRDKSSKPRFDIENEEEQKRRGRRFLDAVLRASEMLPVAEDLGLIPPYVGEILGEFNVPGYKVMRWEKRGGEYLNPEEYRPLSLATTSTHDTETLRKWWIDLEKKEKRLFWKMLEGKEVYPSSYGKFLARTLESLLGGASKLAVLPLQDILGIDARINSPNTVGGHNWSWRIPFVPDRLPERIRSRMLSVAEMIKKRRKR